MAPQRGHSIFVQPSELDEQFHESCHKRGIHLDFRLLYRSRVPKMERGNRCHGSVAASD